MNHISVDCTGIMDRLTSKLAYKNAIKNNDIVTLQSIIAVYPDIPNAYDDLVLMCEYGHLDMAKWWHDREYASIKIYTTTRPLKRAATNGHLHVVKWLLKIANLSHSESMCVSAAINSACIHGHLNVVMYMYDYIKSKGEFFGHSENYPTRKEEYLLVLACIHEHFHIVDYLIDVMDDNKLYVYQAFIECSELGKLISMQYLLNRSTMDDDTMKAALNASTKYGHNHVMQWLLDTFHDYNNDDFANALNCGPANLDVMHLLMQKYPNIIEHDYTTLFSNTCLTNQPELVRWLIDMSDSVPGHLDICFRDACTYGRLEMAQLLAAKFSEIHVYIVNNMEALAVVICKNRHLPLVEWLTTSYPNTIDVFCKASIDDVIKPSHTKTHIFRYMVDNFDNMDIHANSEYIFTQACEKDNLPLIRLFTEYSNTYVSYHLVNGYGYMISLNQINTTLYYRELNDVHVYTSSKSNIDCVMKDAGCVLQMFGKKSANKN